MKNQIQKDGDFYKTHFYNYLKIRNVEITHKHFLENKFIQSCAMSFLVSNPKHLSEKQLSAIRSIIERSP